MIHVLYSRNTAPASDTLRTQFSTLFHDKTSAGVFPRNTFRAGGTSPHRR